MCIVSKHLEKVLCFEKCAFWSLVVNYVSRVLKNDMKVLLLGQKWLYIFFKKYINKLQQLTFCQNLYKLGYMLFCLVVSSELWENCDLSLKQKQKIVIINHFRSEGDRNVK